MLAGAVVSLGGEDFTGALWGSLGERGLGAVNFEIVGDAIDELLFFGEALWMNKQTKW